MKTLYYAPINPIKVYKVFPMSVRHDNTYTKEPFILFEGCSIIRSYNKYV